MHSITELPAWERLFKKIVWQQLGDIEGKKILDFGSGEGITANHFASNNEVIAIEPSVEMLANVWKDYEYTQIVGDVSALSEFEDETFDECQNDTCEVSNEEAKESLSDIVDFLKDKIITVWGNQKNVFIDNLADVEHTKASTLDWVSPEKVNKQEIAEQSQAKVLLVDNDVRPIEGKTLIVVDDPKVSLAEIGNHFFVSKHHAEIHPTAIISPKAKIGKDCYIGPYCVIGNTTIGNGCVLDAYVRVYDDVTIGDYCSIKAGAVLGGEGFGFVKDNNGNRFRFPQIGNLHIGNHVEIGANTCIDRATMGSTVIADNVKIDNLVQVAHNVEIGENTVCCAQTGIAGSAHIGKQCILGGQSGINGHIFVKDGTKVGPKAGLVSEPKKEGMSFYGNPALEYNLYMRSYAIFRRQGKEGLK